MTIAKIASVMLKVFRQLILVFFGITLGFVVSLFSFAAAFSGSAILGSFQILAAVAGFYGTYGLGCHMFDMSLEKTRLGMLSGSLSMLAFALTPFVHTLREEYLQIPSPISHMGLAGIWSLIALFPFIVFVLLATESTRKPQVS